jgi:predicted kinase
VKVTILRGVSGSGKSTWAKAHDTTQTTVVSADQYFMRYWPLHNPNANYAELVHGDDPPEVLEYRFDPAKQGEAHAQCLRRFIDELLVSSDHLRLQHLIVDNTNTTLVEIAPYIAVARAYGAEVRVLEFRVLPADAARRNVHGVPWEVIEKQSHNLYTSSLQWPAYWPTIEVQEKT